MWPQRPYHIITFEIYVYAMKLREAFLGGFMGAAVIPVKRDST